MAAKPSHPVPPLIFTFDIGTSSLRTTLVDGRGGRLPETTAQESYLLRLTADGGAELSPAILKRAAKTCIARTLAIHRDRSALRRLPISGVAASCFWHSLIGTDEMNRPLTRVFTWMDSRCRADAAALREELGERAIHARTGCMLRASYWPAKLAWLYRVDRPLFQRVRRWMSPAEWLYREFTGEAQCGLSMASGTGLLNAHTLAWDDALLDRFHLTPAHLNDLTEDPVDASRPARAFPQLAGARWYPALGDGAASNLGSGATRPGLAAINVGTSAALRVMRAGPVRPFPFGLFCYRVDAARQLIGGAVSNAGNLRAWCLRELRLDENDVERSLAARPLPAHGLTVLPYWSAERAPTWDEDRRGRIDGITFSTTAFDILQALIEAGYYRIALIADLIVKQEATPPRFIVSGGIQHSPSSLQRLANILNRPIYLNPEPEASIRGAAIYALEREDAAITPLRLSRPVRPQRAAAAAYEKSRARQASVDGSG
jgi:gluconokinase